MQVASEEGEDEEEEKPNLAIWRADIAHFKSIKKHRSWMITAFNLTLPVFAMQLLA